VNDKDELVAVGTFGGTFVANESSEDKNKVKKNYDNYIMSRNRAIYGNMTKNP
jgi:hypothetical protein